MTKKYRSYRRAQGVFYWQEIGTTRRGSLKTKDPVEAERLLTAMNEAHRQPILNLALGRTYLAAHDPRMIQRTWNDVMTELSTHGIESTQERCRRAMLATAYNLIREKPLVETTAEDFLRVLGSGGTMVAYYLRRLHNLALDLGWLAWPVLTKKAWPKIRNKRKRGITAAEHAAIVGAEHNPERRAFYELLWETGASQTDAANLRAEDVDWNAGVLAYRRKKLGPDGEPARLTVGVRLRMVLSRLPRTGFLFPHINGQSANHRAAEFRRRCRLLKIDGVSLHSYRHAWAQRAKACGMPQRFAEEALGHNSRAIHNHYARGATVVCPSLEEYEKERPSAFTLPLVATART